MLMKEGYQCNGTVRCSAQTTQTNKQTNEHTHTYTYTK
jgi:hypothetical protein